LGGRARTYPLVDEHGNDEDEDEEDDDEDDDDTGLALRPVLLALHELVDSVLGASHEGHVDGGHCECGGFLDEEKMVSRGSVREYICAERCANCGSCSTRCETKIGSEGSHPRVQVESGPRPALARKV
jgi:hypothetical protein